MIKDPKNRRADLIERLADHVLGHGLENASLRPLAAAIGTSDRMLLYYFADKNDLMTAVLLRIAERLQGRLEAIVPAQIHPLESLRETVRTSLLSPDLRPYMRVWLEIAARAGREEEPFKTIGAAIGRGFLGWIGLRLTPEQQQDAARLLIAIEGILMLDALGLSDVADKPFGD
jgi:AcrR family transcriptional regulator